jgi:hypothetical protein
MANTLFPAFVKLEYTTTFAPHVAILPIRDTPIFDADPELTTVENWDGAQVPLSDMVIDLATAMAKYYTADDAFTLYSTWTMLTPTSDPVFQETLRLDPIIVGTGTTIGWQKAVQSTHSFRTSLGGTSKLVCLDAGSFNAWDKQVDPTGSADLLAIIAAWTSNSNAFAGRDGGRPSTFMQLTKTLNEKLRRAYRMT